MNKRQQRNNIMLNEQEQITISLVLIQFTMICYGGIYTVENLRLRTDSHRPNEGKVEIFYNDLWGSCANYRLDDQTASVICRLLNLGVEGLRVDYYYTTEATPWVFSSLICNGSETNVFDCDFRLFDSIVSYTDGVGVICKDFDYSMLRLEGSVDDASEGRLQFLYDSRWVGLCEDFINYESYHLACRQMGYELVREFTNDDVQIVDNTNILPFEYFCERYYTNLEECSTAVYSDENCSQSGRIKIKCGDAPRITTVRLVNGSDASEGRVEVFDGEWRTVCSEGFTASAVDTVCKQVGWKTALSSGLNPGDGTLGIIPYLFYCNTYESLIGNCTLINRNYSCSHTDDVSVKCSNFRITDTRLVNGTDPQEGRLEIRVDDAWMTVCDSTFLNQYSENGLDTVCRSLGYRGALDVLPDAYFGEGSGGIVTHYFSCPTYGSSLDNCTVGYNDNSGCKNHSQDLSVVCGDLEIEDIRLVDGTGVNEGRVEMFIDKEWRTVCDVGWSNEEANVLCRSMGFARAEEFYNNAHFGQGTGRVFSNVFDCSGLESHIQNCNITHRGHTCSHSDDISVRCVACEELSIPTNGQMTITGTLHGDVARFECDSGFDVTGSSVRVCLSNNTWNGTDTECVRDIDECLIYSGICTNGQCVNTRGAFRCDCNDGFIPDMMEQMCMDEDECSANSSICSNGVCENFIGGYQCTCNEGFEQNSQKTACLVTDGNSEDSDDQDPKQGDNLKEGLLYGGVCVALLTGIAVGICISVYYRRKMRRKNAVIKTSNVTSILRPISNGEVPGGGVSLVNSSDSYRSLQQGITTTTNEGTVNYNSNGSVDLNHPAPPLNLSSLLKTSDSYHSV